MATVARKIKLHTASGTALGKCVQPNVTWHCEATPNETGYTALQIVQVARVALQVKLASDCNGNWTAWRSTW